MRPLQPPCKTKQAKFRTHIRNVRRPSVLGSEPDEHGPAIAADCFDVSPMKKEGGPSPRGACVGGMLNRNLEFDVVAAALKQPPCRSRRVPEEDGRVVAPPCVDVDRDGRALKFSVINVSAPY